VTKVIDKEEKSFREGLQDIVAAESSICFIDGQKGVLSYRGFDIHDLAENSSFEEICFLLWEGRLPDSKELEKFRDDLSANRKVSEDVLRLVKNYLDHGMIPMDALRTAVSALCETDPDVGSNEPSANRRKALRLTGQMATLVAAIHRFREGKDPIEPREGRPHAEDFLALLNGKDPSPEMSHAFDVALVLHADHELNASTFAARVTAATLSDMHSAVVSAIGTLKGPLHGGANEAVIRMLVEIGDLARVDDYIHDLLAKKKKIMGFGHRVYTTEDPRATHLRAMSRQLGESSGEPLWYEMSRRIEMIINQEKHLNCNVDFYSASTYYMLGIPADLYTPIFALSRCSGWVAHVMEQHQNNRLIRPRAEYLGPVYPKKYVSLGDR
jgi:citrate synthase